MLTPPKSIIKLLQQYDKHLYVIWNNIEKCFEVWRKMPWGNRLITPVTNIIYGLKDNSFCPLDHRILNWIIGADSLRNNLAPNWKWMAKKTFMEQRDKRRKACQLQFKEIAAEQYSYMNNGLLGMCSGVNGQNQANWLRPDLSDGKLMYRSAENAKRFFDDSARNNR